MSETTPTSRTGTERPAADIVFDHVTKRYPGQQTPALDDLSMTVPAGETCCLVGPSGGGKTTAMKLVNRLIDFESGDITIGGQSIRSVDVTTLRRDIGYVIQQVGLFPHMTIAGNIGVIPGLLGWSRDRIKKRTDELLDLVRLDRSFASRYPAQLSGGQQQRVGLARALAVDPPVMLMDEPFGALDPITRTEIQDEFLNLESEISKTVIFVTHDIDEAIKMGDRIAVLRQGGVLAQYGTADELLAHPADEYVADFVGADRGLKRLSLRRMREVVAGGDGASNGASPYADAPSVDADATLRIGLSTLFASGAPAVQVTDGGRLLGTVTLDQLQDAVAGSSS
ncbi:ABC transporter ATP-binding protein [Actinomycetospora sp. TBRC 11914]|uniref:ABC transporter ATP-binding protein n=1 Tax=Actinomycetospora sp. TBRC 11914 TaxID=2729387 RepID=UPI00145F9673|nr:ABC transporter ATP-binding protein [Actinomycetospora sp. TBRC 11914]NMO92436.1 ABC transporter ATP-binding protein [Actinomycetospora sp. TBRC 11914]